MLKIQQFDSCSKHNFTLRLDGGLLSTEGRVEVYVDGHWGSLCNDGFDRTDAGVICRQLGYQGYKLHDLIITVDNILITFALKVKIRLHFQGIVFEVFSC